MDIRVEFDPQARVGLLRFIDPSEELSKLFGRQIDLVTKTGLKPWIRPRVLKEAQILYTA